MRRLLLRFCSVLLVSMFAITSCWAQTAVAGATATVPPLVKVSGTLANAQATVGVTFALYAEQTGGAPLWLETQNVTPDANGRYTVYLGANHANGVPLNLFASGEARWLGVQPEGQPEQARAQLVSVPYALTAGDAQTLGGQPLSAFVLASAANGRHGDERRHDDEYERGQWRHCGVGRAASRGHAGGDDRWADQLPGQV